MPKINVLSPHIADLIAAGEVVERPASVAKELVENAIDAGATFITVETIHGGITYLRVTDDGCGIAREDVKTALLRHSTSKIREEVDLDHIATLGFRGEALAAISSVSKIDILTKTQRDEIGCALHQEGGVIHALDDAGCPDGTTLIVRELFYNTPARMKFLKRDTAEAAAVEAVVISAALSHPGISFRMIRDNKVTLHTPGDSRLDSCVYSVLGREIAAGMIPVAGKNECVDVHGFTSKPIAARGNRMMQYFFVNGRAIKSRMLAAALEEAYSNLLMKGRYPTCVLFIKLPYELIDVNVHPTKTEVKFAREKEVFDAVYFSVKSTLMKDTAVVSTQIPEVHKASGSPITEESSPVLTPHAPTPKPLDSTPIPQSGFCPKQQITRMPEKPNAISEVRREMPKTTYPQVAEMKIQTSPEREEANQTLFSPNIPMQKEKPPAPEFRVAGEILDTYIIVEDESGMILIDKHAAHERILFEKLLKQETSSQAQMFLQPVVVSMTEQEIDILEEHREILIKLGFEVDRFSDGSVAVRQVPDGIEEGDVPGVISELAEHLRAGKRLDAIARRDAILHSIACKAAIKAGMKSNMAELYEIAKAVMERGDIRYCPHGRPVAVSMTRYQLEKLFNRS